ncbi:uncharacterized protein LOC111721672 [Sarcophilus harrisii]|uniref:uncharacterized protein LOC111721672 n=1 Tax=Sarcophilus harrisii TaxID=9305 RepID=UPI000C7A8D6A|nr:uncharacterized protein LOC111721672 [Sarcophilus harrisii]
MGAVCSKGDSRAGRPNSPSEDSDHTCLRLCRCLIPRRRRRPTGVVLDMHPTPAHQPRRRVAHPPDRSRGPSVVPARYAFPRENKMMMVVRISCFTSPLVHFSLRTAAPTLTFVLLDLPRPTLLPLTMGTMTTTHLMRLAAIWTLAKAVSFPRFICQNLCPISLEWTLGMPLLPAVLDCDCLVTKTIRPAITSAYFPAPPPPSARACPIPLRVQSLTTAAETRSLELEDAVPSAPNRRKTPLLPPAPAVVSVISRFPLSFFAAVIASADAKTKSAACFACQWFALINRRSGQLAPCGVENSENPRLLVSKAPMSPKLLLIFWFLSLGLSCDSPAFLCSLITRPDVEELDWTDTFPSCVTLRFFPCESFYCRLFNWTLELSPCSDIGYLNPLFCASFYAFVL